MLVCSLDVTYIVIEDELKRYYEKGSEEQPRPSSLLYKNNGNDCWPLHVCNRGTGALM